LLFIELKAPNKPLCYAYHDNLRDYRQTIPHLFCYHAFVFLSNGSQAKVGSALAGFEHFADWKKIDDEGETEAISLETLIRGTCKKSRFMDLLENFIIFQEALGGLIKLVAKNHQYLRVNNAIRAVLQLKENQGRLGVFWHTQGSGKSAAMIFFTQKVLRKMPGNWTFVLVTDRVELDDQIYKTFASSGIINEQKIQTESRTHLRSCYKKITAIYLRRFINSELTMAGSIPFYPTAMTS